MKASAEQLARGQVGTVVGRLDQDEGKQYRAEFADLEGREYAMHTWRNRSCCHCTTRNSPVGWVE